MKRRFKTMSGPTLCALLCFYLYAIPSLAQRPLTSLAPTEPPANSECMQKKGILIIAHGKSGHSHDDHNNHENHRVFNHNLADEWESTVLNMVHEAAAKIPYPVEVAFGMWEQKNFQKAVNHLSHQNVCYLKVIPLFISDYSDVIRAQKYQFHLSESNPLPFDPGRITIPSSMQVIRYGSALNSDLALSQIIEKRAQELSHNPAKETLILVAHGPNGDDDDLLWIRDLSIHAGRIQAGFAQTRIATLRDDAPAPIQDRKTQELRGYVEEAKSQGFEPIIVPVLLAPGGIEAGLIERLQGLKYRYSNHMLAPDNLLIDWIIEQSN